MDIDRPKCVKYTQSSHGQLESWRMCGAPMQLSARQDQGRRRLDLHALAVMRRTRRMRAPEERISWVKGAKRGGGGGGCAADIRVWRRHDMQVESTARID